MSQSQSTEGDLKFFLPKEGSSTVSLPKVDSSKKTKAKAKTKTKTIDLHIEDFLGKLNDALQRQAVLEDFISSPVFLIGNRRAEVNIWFDDEVLHVNVHLDDECFISYLRSFLVTGSCGNLTFEKRSDAGAEKDCELLSVELGSVEDLKKAMTTTGNHKLDLQVTLTALMTHRYSDNDQWIIPK